MCRSGASARAIQRGEAGRRKRTPARGSVPVPWVGFRSVLIPLDERISGSFVSFKGARRGTAMCDKCTELDGKIEDYERIAASIPTSLRLIESKNWWNS